MHALAAASQGQSLGAWAYLAVLAATAAGYMGVPFIGTVAIATAAVFASQGELNIAAVLIVSAAGNEIGGLLGYKIGDRWGRRIRLVLDAQGEAGHVEVAMAAVNVDQQIQVAVGSCLAAGHGAEDPDVTHAEALAEPFDRIPVRAYLVQRDGTPRSLNLHVPTSSQSPQRIEAGIPAEPEADPAHQGYADRNSGPPGAGLVQFMPPGIEPVTSSVSSGPILVLHPLWL